MRLTHALPLAFAALALASLVYALVTKLVLDHDPLWDLRVYQGAVDAHLAGAPVYGVQFDGLRFVYPPLVLEAMALLGPWLTPVMLAGYAAALALFLAYAPGSLRIAVLLYFGVLAFVSEPLIAGLRTGNFSVFATLLILLAWRHAPRLGQGPLIALIVVCAAAKPQYAAFLALGLLSGRLDAASWLRAGLGLALVAAIWGAQAVLAPQAFAAFLASLDAQLGLRAAGADMGQGVFAHVHALTQSTPLALAAHAGFMLVVLGIWAALFMRLRRADLTPQTRRALICNGAMLVCLLASPRLKIYDTAVLGLICIEAGVLWGRARFGPHMWALPLVGLAAGMGALRLVLTGERGGLSLDSVYAHLQPLALLLFCCGAVWAAAGRRGGSG